MAGAEARAGVVLAVLVELIITTSSSSSSSPLSSSSSSSSLLASSLPPPEAVLWLLATPIEATAEGLIYVTTNPTVLREREGGGVGGGEGG